MQPDPSGLPVTLDGRGRAVERIRGLLDREPAEIAQLHDARLLGIELFEVREGGVEAYDIEVRAVLRNVDAGERHPDAAVALGSVASPRVIDEDIAHEPRDDADEMSAVLPVHACDTAQPQVGLVDEGGRLQGVIATFVGELSAGDRTQLGIDGIDQAIARAGIARSPRLEQLSE